MPILTLLTDFGTADYYVAAVKGTVLRLAPETTLVDISHQVPPGDVESAAFLLAAAAPSFPDGSVHLAVVDPGVGSGRRILAARAPPPALFHRRRTTACSAPFSRTPTPPWRSGRSSGAISSCQPRGRPSMAATASRRWRRGSCGVEPRASWVRR